MPAPTTGTQYNTTITAGATQAIRLTGAAGVYGELTIWNHGPGAMLAYEHIRYGLAASDQAARKSMRRQLMRYCELDTAAMVMVWKHWLG